MQVESTEVPILNVESMPSHSIQTAYTPTPMAAQHPEDAAGLLTLRRSNVDGEFYPQEFDHEEVVKTMDEERSQPGSMKELWKRRVFEVSSRRVQPEVPNGSLLERGTRLAERPERSLPSAHAQELAEPPQQLNSIEFWQAQPMDEVRRLAVELNRHLELGRQHPTVRGSGPTDESYSPRFVESRMPSVIRPTPEQA